MAKVSYFILGLLLCAIHYNDVSGNPHTVLFRDNGGRIVGGYNTTIQDAPYQAYLLLQVGDQLYQCGGSIISKRVILTAAHCLTGVSTVYIRLGSTYANEGGKTYTSFIYQSHPLYDPTTSEYDVGVIRVLGGFTVDGITTKIVRLPDEGEVVPTGTDLLVTGWGDTTENGETSENLMAVVVPTVSYEDCRAAYGDDSITERMICAGFPEGGRDACQGDSGGPAVSQDNGKQVGIVSFGMGCARPDYPGVYTNVAAVRLFIRIFAGV